MSSLLSGFQFQSIIHHSHFHLRFYCNSSNFNHKFGYLNDPQLLLEYVREQSKLGFRNLEFPLSLFRQLMNLPRRPLIVDFNPLLSAMVKLKHLRPHSIVISLLRELEFSGVRPDSHSATILANCFCHLGRVDLGFSVFGKSLKIGYPVESNVFFLKTLLHGLILSDQPRQAVKLLDKVVVKLGVELDHVAYDIMIEGLCSIGDNAGALRLLHHMNSRISSCNLDLVIKYTALIDRLCKDRLPNEAISLSLDMKNAGIRPNVITYNSLIRGMSILGRKGEATKMLIEKLKSNITPNIVTYAELLNGCFLCDRLDEARKVVDLMMKNNCAPDVVTFNTLIDGYLRLNSIEKALVVLQQMFQRGTPPNVFTYNTLIDGLCKFDRIPTACQVFSDMQIHGVKPDSVTYGSLLDAFCKSGQVVEASALFREMESNGVTPSIFIYNIVINCCVLDTTTYNIVIKWLCRKGLMIKAMELLSKMERSGCAPNSVTYNTVVEGCIANGDFMNAARYRDIMVNRGFEVDNNTTSISQFVELLQKFT